MNIKAAKIIEKEIKESSVLVKEAKEQYTRIVLYFSLSAEGLVLFSYSLDECEVFFFEEEKSATEAFDKIKKENAGG